MRAACTSLLTLHPLSLACRIKLNFKRAFKINSLSCNIDFTIIFPTSHLHKNHLSISTKTPDFHTPPCFSIPASSTMDTKSPSMENQHCRDTSVGEAEDQGAGVHTHAGCHRNVREASQSSLASQCSR